MMNEQQYIWGNSVRHTRVEWRQRELGELRWQVDLRVIPAATLAFIVHELVQRDGAVGLLWWTPR